MIPINTVHQRFYQDWGKEQSGDLIPPELFGLLVEHGMMIIFNDLTRDYQRNQVVNEKIAYWLTYKDLFPVNGVVDAPDDYLYFSSAKEFRYINGDCDQGITTLRKIDLIRNDEIDDRQSSALIPVDKYPIMERVGANPGSSKNGFSIWPRDIKSFRLSYIKRPKTPVWNYQVLNGEAVFDPNGSVDVEMPDQNLNELVRHMIDTVSVTAREDSVIQMQQMIRQVLEQEKINRL